MRRQKDIWHVTYSATVQPGGENSGSRSEDVDEFAVVGER